MVEAGALFHEAGEGTPNDAFGLPRTIRIPPEATKGAFSLWEEVVPEDAGPPLHVHRTEAEVFVVLEGRIRFRCGETLRDIGPGASAMIPAGAPHSFKGLGPGRSRVLILLSPGTGMNMFRDVAAENLAPPADMDRIAEIAAGYGVEFVGPPLD